MFHHLRLTSTHLLCLGCRSATPRHHLGWLSSRSSPSSSSSCAACTYSLGRALARAASTAAGRQRLAWRACRPPTNQTCHVPRAPAASTVDSHTCKGGGARGGVRRPRCGRPPPHAPAAPPAGHGRPRTQRSHPAGGLLTPPGPRTGLRRYTTPRDQQAGYNQAGEGEGAVAGLVLQQQGHSLTIKVDRLPEVGHLGLPEGVQRLQLRLHTSTPRHHPLWLPGASQ